MLLLGSNVGTTMRSRDRLFVNVVPRFRTAAHIHNQALFRDAYHCADQPTQRNKRAHLTRPKFTVNRTNLWLLTYPLLPLLKPKKCR